ncbi:MAG: DUF5777 family beta-barrel protein [Rhodothermales bacterium]
MHAFLQAHRAYGYVLTLILLFFVTYDAAGQDVAQLSVEELESRVADLFGRSCARVGCHAGPVPQQGMDLSREKFYALIVDEPSREMPALKRVHPGQPEISYLVMKVKGAPGIKGVQMPLIGDKLTEEEINTIETWISKIDEVDQARKVVEPEVAYPFLSWKVVNLPTTRTLAADNFFFLIGHRFVPPVNTGYDGFYGLDGSGIIFLNFGYAPTDNLLIVLGRSNAADDVELQTRYQITPQRLQGGSPIGIGVQGSVNWITEGEDAFKFTAQTSFTRKFGESLGVAFVPGILFNPAEETDGEDPLITLGMGGRWNFWRNISLVAEWVPIVSGYTETFTVGNFNRFDSWGGAIEVATGGHVFQIVISNTVGLTSDQYLRGGDLDIKDFFDGEFRLGFNIFRVLDL